MSKRIGLCLILTLLTAGCFKSKTEVIKIPTNADIKNNVAKPLNRLDGVPYRLPRTVIQATIPVKKVQKSLGPFADFAPCFFTKSDLEDMIVVESTKYSLLPPTFSGRGEPDPQESYVAKIKGGYFENKSLLMDYTPSGVLKKGEAESKDESVEFTLKAIKTAASIAGSIVGARGLSFDPNAVNPDDEQENALVKRGKTCYQTIQKYAAEKETIAQNKLNSAVNALAVADSMQKQKALEKSEAAKNSHDAAVAFKNRADQSVIDFADRAKTQQLVDDYEKAEIAFRQLEAMQVKREDLVSNAANVSTETFTRLLDETDKMVESYRAAFLGTAIEKVWKGVFEFRPDNTSTQTSHAFFSYSAADGLCETSETQVQGQHIPPKFQNEKCSDAKDLALVWLRVTKDMDDQDFRDQMKTASENAKLTDPKRGWYYRIPARATVYLMSGDMDEVNTNSADRGPSVAIRTPTRVEVGRSDLLVAQLGVTASIPASAAGRTNQSAITLDEATGALANFKYTSNSLLEKSMLDDVESASKDLIDAKDPLKKKKRELDLLKTEKDIRDARKALEGDANSNTGNP